MQLRHSRAGNANVIAESQRTWDIPTSLTPPQDALSSLWDAEPGYGSLAGRVLSRPISSTETDGGNFFEPVLSPAAGPNQAPVFTVRPFSIERVPTGAAGGSEQLLLTRHGDAYSADGRMILFSSTASNLVAGDTNGQSDIFLKDLVTGEIRLVSTSSSGAQAMTGGAYNASFSPDGTKVIFESLASDYGFDDTAGSVDIFIKDLVTGELTRITQGGLQGGETPGTQASFSPDGTKVVFTSASSTLVAGDTNGIADIFVMELATGAVTRVSTGPAGQQAVATQSYQTSYGAVFSPDGTKIAFSTDADLAGLSGPRLYVKNLLTGQLTLIAAHSREAEFSADGTKLVFTSQLGLAGGDGNGAADVYVKNLVTGTTMRISNPIPNELDLGGSLGRFSADGTQVIYRHGSGEVWLQPVSGGAPLMISRSDSGDPGGQGLSGNAHFAPDGASLIFESSSNRLVPGQANGPGLYEVRLDGSTSPNGAGEAYFEGGLPSKLVFDLKLADDNANFAGGNLSIRFIDGFRQGDMLVAVATHLPTTGVLLLGNDVKVGGVIIGTLTRSGQDMSIALNANATPARIEYFLQALLYASATPDSVQSGTRTFQIELIDGAGTAGGGQDRTSFTRTIEVVATDDPPTANYTIIEMKSDAVYVLQASDFAFNDVDGDQLLSVLIDATRITAGEGRLLFDPDGPGGVSAQLVGVAEISLADIALGRLAFAPNREFEGQVYFQMRFRSDSGMPGTDLSDLANFFFNVQPGPRAPIVELNSSPIEYHEGENYQTSTKIVSSQFEIMDPDSSAPGTIVSVTVQITGGLVTSEDRLHLAVGGYPVTATYDAFTGRLTMTSSEPLHDSTWAQLVWYVEYSNLSDTPSTNVRTITITASDGVFTSAPVTQTLTVVPANDRPTVDIDPMTEGTNGRISVLEGADETLLAPNATISDPDSTSFGGGRLTVEFPPDPFHVGLIGIRHSGSSAGQIGINGSSVSYGGIVFGTVSGAGTTLLTVAFNDSASQAAVQALVRALTYENVKVGPFSSAASAVINLYDGDGLVPGQGAVLVSYTLYPDPPVLDLNGGAPGRDNSISYSPGQPSQLLTPLATIADPDTGFAFTSVTATLLNPGAGDNLTILLGPGPDQVRADEFGNLSIRDVPLSYQVMSPTSGRVQFFSNNVSPEIVNILLRSLGYLNDQGSPATYERIFAFTFAGGDNTVTQFASVTFPGGSSTPLPLSPTPVAVDDNLVVHAHQATTLSITDNDIAATGVAKTIVRVGGMAIGNGSTVTLPSGATVLLNANGSITYTPNGALSSGPDFFVYQLANGTHAIARIQASPGTGGPLTGTDGVDNLTGTELADTIRGLAGSDILSGAGGGDYIDGGAGDDQIYGGAGADLLFGDQGNDLLDGGMDADRMTGGSGDDTYIVDNAGDVVVEQLGGGTDEVRTSLASYVLHEQVERLVYTGTAGAQLTGNGIANTITGGAGADRIDGGSGADRMIGGAGDDVYYVEDAGDVVVELAGGGNDEVRTTLASYTMTDHVERLVYLGTTGTQLTGNGTANIISGGDRADRIDGGAGADRMTGGLGDDTYIVDNVGDVIVELADGGNDEVLTSLTTYTLAANLERLAYSGTAAAQLTGNGADNIITGGTGADRIDGGAGADRMIGGAGDDTYIVDHVEDVVVELPGGGNDEVRTTLTNYLLGDQIERLIYTGTAAAQLTGNGAANTITGGAGADRIDGGAGADQMIGGGGDDIYIVDNTGDVVVELAGGGTDEVRTALASYTIAAHIERLIYTGTVGAQLAGNAQANFIQGGSGNDRLDGGAGADQLTGGLGDDTYIVDNAGDVVTELADGGSDEVRTSLTTYALGANLERLVYIGTAATQLTGNGAANTITGGTGADRIDGGTGADQMIGGLGDDIYIVDHVGDVVTELAGGGNDEVRTALSAYSLGANLERLVYTGTAAAQLTGNNAANVIEGGIGGDTIDGGLGADRNVALGLDGLSTHTDRHLDVG